MLTINRRFASLWCNLGVIWANTKHLKSRTMALGSGSSQIGGRSLKLGTKHSFWSRDCKNIRGQSWRSKENLPVQPDPGCGGFESGRVGNFFLDLQLWPLIFLQPLDLQECTVSHLKDLINIYLENESQGHGMTFNIIYHCSKYPYFISYRGLC